MLVPNARMADAERISGDEVGHEFHKPQDPFSDFAIWDQVSSVNARSDRVTCLTQKVKSRGRSPTLVIGGLRQKP